MQGVEILSQSQVVTEIAWNPTAFWIAAIIIFIIFFMVDIFMGYDSMDSAPFVVCIITSIIFSVIFGYLLGTVFATPTAYENQYEVTISDEVLMNDFLEHYEVIDQDGKIFTVREKINESN